MVQYSETYSGTIINRLIEIRRYGDGDGSSTVWWEWTRSWSGFLGFYSSNGIRCTAILTEIPPLDEAG